MYTLEKLSRWADISYEVFSEYENPMFNPITYFIGWSLVTALAGFCMYEGIDSHNWKYTTGGTIAAACCIAFAALIIIGCKRAADAGRQENLGNDNEMQQFQV